MFVETRLPGREALAMSPTSRNHDSLSTDVRHAWWSKVKILVPDQRNTKYKQSIMTTHCSGGRRLHHRKVRCYPTSSNRKVCSWLRPLMPCRQDPLDWGRFGCSSSTLYGAGGEGGEGATSNERRRASGLSGPRRRAVASRARA